jgi:hypothetical protein
MRYDLAIAHARCSDRGLVSKLEGDRLEIRVGENVVLWIQNAKADEDCAIGFEDTPWHVHDELIFVDPHGNYVEMSYLEMLDGLADGQLLICEMRASGEINDRWLIHCMYNDVFKGVLPNEELKVFRASLTIGSSDRGTASSWGQGESR